jgi:hypothetical protein
MRALSTLLLSLLLPGILCAAEGDPDPEEILARARARAAAEEFQPFRYRIETHSWIRDGDGELEHEERGREERIKWSPDSTQVIGKETELLFGEEKIESEEDDGDKKRERKLDLSFGFFDPEHEGEYRFEFEGFVDRDGRRLAEFELEPRKRKQDNWRGRLYLDPPTGALEAVDLQPGKGRFGMKRMRIRAELREILGMDRPRRIDMDIEVKVIFLFHKKIQTRVEFAYTKPVP